jgi:hypothetical protein
MWLKSQMTEEEEEEITSFQPHQADETTYKQESVELVCINNKSR